MVLAEKNHPIPSLPKNDHCSPLAAPHNVQQLLPGKSWHLFGPRLNLLFCKKWFQTQHWSKWILISIWAILNRSDSQSEQFSIRAILDHQLENFSIGAILNWSDSQSKRFSIRAILNHWLERFSIGAILNLSESQSERISILNISKSWLERFSIGAS